MQYIILIIVIIHLVYSYMTYSKFNCPDCPECPVKEFKIASFGHVRGQKFLKLNNLMNSTHLLIIHHLW